MLSKHISFLTRLSISSASKRTICCSSILYKKKRINPILRTWNILRNDFQNILPSFDETRLKALNSFPSHTDVLVIGGGIMGTSVAYWLKEKSGSSGIDVTVVEKDPTVRLSY